MGRSIPDWNIMEPVEVLKTLKRWTGMTLGDIAGELGYLSVSGLCDRLQRKDPRIDFFLEVLDMYGYECTVQPKQRSGARKDGQILVKRPNKGET